MGSIKKCLFLLAFFSVVTAGLLVTTQKSLATTGVNQQLSFSGKIVKSDGTNITDGTYNMEFKIYQDGTSSGSGSTLEWTEDYLVAGSSGVPSTGGVSLSSGTFQVNLGSICSGFAAGTCGAKTNAGVDFNQQTLWLSIQIGNSTACTVTSATTSFNTACGGDGEMSPYIRLTAVPQAFNADKLDGLDSTAFGQLGSSQSWTGTNTFQPGTNVTSAIIKQNGNGSPTADILDVQTQNATNILQVTGPAINEAAVTIKSVGATRDLTIDSGSGTIKIGSTATTLQKSGSTFTLDVSNGASNSTLVVADSGGAGNITLQLDSGGTYAVGASTGSTTTCSGGNFLQNPVVTGGIITGGACAAGGGGSGVTAIGTFSNTSIANGASIASTTLTLGAADTSNPGGVSTTTQSFAGNKTFTGTVAVATSSSSALTVQNSSSQNVISIDTSGTNSGNLISNPSIESAISGNWAQKGSGTGTAVSQDSTQQYFGASSLKIISGTAVTTDGVKQTLGSTLTASTQYNVAFYVKPNNNTTPTVKVVYSVDGSAESVACSLQLQLTSNSWQRYSCTFATPASGMTASNAIFIELTTASQTVYVDGVIIQLSSSADANYREGNIVLQGNVASPLVLQDNTNDQMAFSVLNKDGAQVFNVDTSDTNLVQNPSFEVNTASWAAKAGGAGTPTIVRDTSQKKYGVASLLVTTSANANDGAKYTLPVAITGTGAQAYTVSFSMMLVASALHNFVIVGATTGGTDGTVCTNAQLSPVPSGTVNVPGTDWVRYTCTWTPANAASVTTIYIAQSDTTARSLYIDAVQVETGSVATSYGLGQVSLSGPVITPLQLKNQSDSSNALQVQNAAGLAMFTIDNVNKFIQIGSSITDANAVLLVVDSYNTAADPTGVNGGIYYNTNKNVLRCYENSIWKNCINPPSNASTADQTIAAATTTYLTGSNISIPSSGLQAGTQFIWRISLDKTDTAATAADTFIVKYGTNGTTADTSEISFTGPTQTAVADKGTITIIVTVRSVNSSTGTWYGNIQLVHNLSATGLANTASYVSNAVSASFNDTVASSIVGITITTAASATLTIHQVQTQSVNL